MIQLERTATAIAAVFLVAGALLAQGTGGSALDPLTLDEGLLS